MITSGTSIISPLPRYSSFLEFSLTARVTRFFLLDLLSSSFGFWDFRGSASFELPLTFGLASD